MVPTANEIDFGLGEAIVDGQHYLAAFSSLAWARRRLRIASMTSQSSRNGQTVEGCGHRGSSAETVALSRTHVSSSLVSFTRCHPTFSGQVAEIPAVAGTNSPRKLGR